MYGTYYGHKLFRKIFLITIILSIYFYTKGQGRPGPPEVRSKKFCVSEDGTLRARHHTCFLRPDTGPCRADFIQWYYDAKATRCYRFFFGGCQGNGNKFETREECLEHCYLPRERIRETRLPLFCTLNYDFGSCFGHYNRWYYDRTWKTCKRRIYSGCGGNQNNFQTLKECLGNCLTVPNNTMGGFYQLTTCIPLDIPELQ